MNGKFEEKLARLAFGDTTSEESAQIEAQVASDPAARRALAEFRDMREGLRGLAEVPEHQLSNERLRDAILARGLSSEAPREASKGLGAGWIWMPVAALSLGFGLMMLRPKAPSGDPHVVLPSSVASRIDFGAGSLIQPSTIPSAVVAKNEPKPVAKTVTAMASPKGIVEPRLVSRRRARYHSPHFTPDVIPLKVKGWKDGNSLLADKSANTPSATRVPVPPTTKPTDPGISGSNSIVLIDVNPDASTGAPAATEVGTASNVLIGG